MGRAVEVFGKTELAGTTDEEFGLFEETFYATLKNLLTTAT